MECGKTYITHIQNSTVLPNAHHALLDLLWVIKCPPKVLMKL